MTTQVFISDWQIFHIIGSRAIEGITIFHDQGSERTRIVRDGVTIEWMDTTEYHDRMEQATITDARYRFYQG